MVPDTAPCTLAPPLNLPDTSVGVRRADDTRWFMEQIQPHEAALRAYLRGRFSSLQDIDDLVQETYARLLRAREIGRASLTRAYLFTVARNVALDVLRHRHAVPIMALEEIDRLAVVEDQPDAAEALSHQQELDLLADAIRALPPRCGEIVRLRRIAGLSYQDIAARLGVTESTVNAQLALGLIRCRHYLSAHGVAKARIHGP